MGGGGRVPGGVTPHTAVVAVVTGQVRVDEALVGVGVGVGLQGHGQAVGGRGEGGGVVVVVVDVGAQRLGGRPVHVGQVAART